MTLLKKKCCFRMHTEAQKVGLEPIFQRLAGKQGAAGGTVKYGPTEEAKIWSLPHVHRRPIDWKPIKEVSCVLLIRK